MAFRVPALKLSWSITDASERGILPSGLLHRPFLPLPGGSGTVLGPLLFLGCLSPLGGLFFSHGLQRDLYTCVFQICIFGSNLFSWFQASGSNCLVDICSWMSYKYLKVTCLDLTLKPTATWYRQLRLPQSLVHTQSPRWGTWGSPTIPFSPLLFTRTLLVPESSVLLRNVS